MASTRIIRYSTKADRADDNAELIRAVFAELSQEKPEGVEYASYRLDDGVSFVHVVTLAGDDNPLLELPAFQEFQADLGERLADGPAQSVASLVGSYRS